MGYGSVVNGIDASERISGTWTTAEAVLKMDVGYFLVSRFEDQSRPLKEQHQWRSDARGLVWVEWREDRPSELDVHRAKMFPQFEERATEGPCSFDMAALTGNGSTTRRRAVASKATPSIPVSC